ncbi:trehalose-phosphatase [Candidimonas sp. SYP-B2681]|uniref:trehalose-phosphatase n=1 Tax=Candidimonas sp. SYP-B2681 TaxID=2497686 RepID=UPI000F85F701|nr:trehalose-phosphatase [Candidimonas sp. SYP-B2681]RTZ48204.1 trehalose-phosphatase [Candidimonas sp. SYP-B2681]
MMLPDENQSSTNPRPEPETLVKGSVEPPRRAFDQLAIFLDLDGTLAPIVPTPDKARVSSATIHLLERIFIACHGALAIVSGRDAAGIERLLAPLRLPYAALHGAELKDPNGEIKTIDVPQDKLSEIVAVVEKAMASLPGTIVERKSLSVALHYRNAPQFQQDIYRLAESALKDHERHFEIQEGKMVIEIKPRHASKGAAIKHFMNMVPFQGRVPVFAGDDLTDEAGFFVVNALNGITIKVGEGPTIAQWRLDDTEALSTWLHTLFVVKGHSGDRVSTNKG